jgi:hypothetical protein
MCKQLDSCNLVNYRLPLFISSSPKVSGEELFQLNIGLIPLYSLAQKDFKVLMGSKQFGNKVGK